jgi:hypothetical protein
MTLVDSRPATRPHPPRAAAFALGRSALALARIEGMRLVRHPVFLAGAALSIAFSLTFADATDIGGDYFVLMGPTLLPLGLATLVVTNLAALRSRRGGTGELYGSIPAPARVRTLAHLLALAWPVAVAAALLVAAFAWFGAWDGLDVTRAGRRATPGPVELAQGPLAVAALGALGVALARWVPHPPAGAVAAVGLLVFQMPFVMWNLQDAPGWFLPLVNPAQSSQAPDSSWPCASDQRWPCLLKGFAPLGWHLAYLAGLGLLLAGLALLRDRRRRADSLLAAAGLTVAVTAGALQVP